MVKGLPAGWGMCFRTVKLVHTPQILTCWKDTIAVGVRCGDILTLDGITGSQMAILSGHDGDVRTLDFSPDGVLLVSGSIDTTIKLWDMQTGGVIKTFHGHTGWVTSVSISVDCTTIASGSVDRSIRLWTIQTGECYHVIEQQHQVDCVKFSPINSQCLISVVNMKVQEWYINGHELNHTYNGSYISFSPNGTQFILCQGKDVIVRNSESGAIMTKFHVDNSNTRHCCFSLDARLVAVAADRAAYVWDTASSHSHPIETFYGHTDGITSLAFSSPSSLISSSGDGSVKFWQIGAPPISPVVTDPESTPLASTPIKSVTLQVKDGIAISSDFDGVVRIWDISNGHCKRSYQTPAKNLQWYDIRLINGRLILVYQDKKIHIWDGEMGELQTLEPTQDVIDDARISEDGSKVFCLHQQSVQAWSIQTGEVVGEVELECSLHRRSLTVDCSRAWVHSPSSEPLGWDFGTPSLSPIQLSNIPSPHLTSTKNFDVGLSRIKNTVTGKVVFQLAGRFGRPHSAQWDGQYLVAGYKSGEVLILDFN